jgi:Flp pilus assembly protein TadB
VLGLSLDEARNIALVGAAAFAVAAIAAIWIMKSIVQKVLVALLLVMLAFAVWSQRESLQECAEQVKVNVTDGIVDAATAGVGTPTTVTPGSETPGGESGTESGLPDTTCTFFGVDVTIP